MAGVFGALREPLDTLTARNPSFPPEVSRALGAEGTVRHGRGLSPGSCPRPLPLLALRTAEKGRLTANGETQKAPKGHESACRVEPDGGGRLCGPHATATCTSGGQLSLVGYGRFRLRR